MVALNYGYNQVMYQIDGCLGEVYKTTIQSLCILGTVFGEMIASIILKYFFLFLFMFVSKFGIQDIPNK